MATVLSAKQVCDRLRRIESLVRDLRQQRATIGRYAESMEREGQTALDIETTINGMLTDWGALRTEIIDELTALPVIHQSRVKIGMPALYSSANIEAANGSHVGVDSEPSAIIRSNTLLEQTKTNGPFHVFLQDDIVSISSAEDSDNNVTGVKVVYNTAAGGRDIITNGGFDSASSWTESGDSGTEIVITGGKAVFTTGTCTLSQAKADMYNAGASNSSSQGWDAILYLVEYTIDGFSAGTISVGTNTTAAQYTLTYSSSVDNNKTHRALIVGDGNAAGLVFTATGFTGNIDNVSMVPFSGIALNYPLSVDNAADSSLVITLEQR